MRLVCSECEASYITTLANTERYSRSLCRMCRHDPRVEGREIPLPRVFGREVDMGRWFTGVLEPVRGWRITK